MNNTTAHHGDGTFQPIECWSAPELRNPVCMALLTVALTADHGVYRVNLK